jgi:hypothetical protein
VAKDTKEAQKQEQDLFLQMSDFHAENIRINTKDPEKFRAYCVVRDKEVAKKFYTEFTRSIELPLKAVIFLDFPESVFVKRGDIEAEKFYK